MANENILNTENLTQDIAPSSIAEGKTGNALVSEAKDHIIAIAQNIYDTGQTVANERDEDGNKVYVDIDGGVKGYQTEINALFNNSIAGLRDKFDDYVPVSKTYPNAISVLGYTHNGYFNFDKKDFIISFGTSTTAGNEATEALDVWHLSSIFSPGASLTGSQSRLVIGSGQFCWDWAAGTDVDQGSLDSNVYGKTFIRSDFGFIQFGNNHAHGPYGAMKLTNQELFIGSGQIQLGTKGGVNIDSNGAIQIGTESGVQITKDKIKLNNDQSEIRVGSDLVMGTQIKLCNITIGSKFAEFPNDYALCIGSDKFQPHGENIKLGTLRDGTEPTPPMVSWGIRIGTSSDSGLSLGTDKIYMAVGTIQIGTSQDSRSVFDSSGITLPTTSSIVIGSTVSTNRVNITNKSITVGVPQGNISLGVRSDGLSASGMTYDIAGKYVFLGSGFQTVDRDDKESSTNPRRYLGLQIQDLAEMKKCGIEISSKSIKMFDDVALIPGGGYKEGRQCIEINGPERKISLGSGILMHADSGISLSGIPGGAVIHPNYSAWRDDQKNSHITIGTQNSATLEDMNWEDWGLSVKNNDRTTYITGTGIIIDTDGGLYFGTDQILSSQGFSRSRALSIKYRDTFNAEKTFEYRGGDSSNNQNTIDLSGGVYYATTSQTATRVANPLIIRKADGSTIEYNGSIKGYEVVEGGVYEITYNELKELRDAGKLSPGVKYRITDYKTTVNTNGYSTTNHKFDIIVEAINKNTLSENAQVCTSSDAGDDYNLSGYVHNLNIGPNNWYEPNKIPQDIISMGLTRDDVKYCDTSKYEIEKCKLEVTFTWVQNSGNKKYNFVGVELIKDGVVISSDYHRGFAGTTVSNNIYTLHVPESGEYSFIFYATTIDQNNVYEEISSTCNALTAKFVDKKYFSNSKLSSWVVKYCLDNDNSRFVWAKSDGKGVIYYLKDENENEAQYDFKNILIDGYYTFDYEINGNHVDGSVLYGKYCHHNKIMFDVSGPPYMNPGLPKIYFKNTSADAKCYYNIFANDIWNVIFGSGCYKNIFETGSEGNTLGDNCYHNVFGAECKNNTIGDNCHHNVFDCECTGSKMGDNCYHNVFGRGCKNNIIGDNCNHNHLQCGCTGVSIGDNCIENSFGFNCHSTGENDYEKIQLANGCCYNTIGNDCSGIKLQENCKYNHIGDGSSKIGFKANGRHNLVEMGWSGTNSNCINGLNGNNIQYIKDANDVQYRMDGFAIDTDIMNLFNSN